MKNVTESAWHSIRQLFRFLFLYMVAVGGVFYLLPMAGLFLENSYDELGRAARLLAVVGFVIAVAAWQLTGFRERWRQSVAHKKAV